MHLELPEPSSSPAAGLESAAARQPSIAKDTELSLTAEQREHMLLADAARYVAEQGERRYRALVEAGAALMWTADANGLVVEMPHWRELTGLPAAEALGDEWLSAVHQEDQQRIRDAFAAARVLGRPVDSELRLRTADGSYRWLAVRTAPVRGEQGEIVEWVGTWTDVHDRKRAEEALTFLSDASRVLLASGDLDTTLERLARLFVSRIADVCSIDLFDVLTGELRRVCSEHVDPAKRVLLREMAHRYPPSAQPLYASATAARSGQTRLLNDLDDLYYLSLAQDDQHLQYLRALAPRSYIAAPLIARGRTLGAVVVTQCESGRRFREPDVAMIEELARRTAQVVDHARQIAAERRDHASAESASRAKSEFLEAMSHEVRVPANSIIGYADLFAQEIVGPLTPAQRERLEHLSAGARHLADLAQQVTTIARIESGREIPDFGDVEIAAVCKDAASALEPEAKARGVHIDFAIGGDVGHRRTDRARLRQILVNLVANAVRSTSAANVQTRVDGEGKGVERDVVSLVVRADREWVRFIVRDAGAGIPATQIGRVFDRFWKTASAAAPSDGTGLDLALSRDLARMLGGDISVESVVGQGSTFTVRLPAQ